MGRLPTRSRQSIPRLARSLLHSRVTSVSAGYAHSIAVTDEGRAFASGQNDRGQARLLLREGHAFVKILRAPTMQLVSNFIRSFARLVVFCHRAFYFDCGKDRAGLRGQL